jgi:LysR family transcriptional activator of dmlA
VELFDRLVDLVEEGFQLDIRIGRVREGNVIKRRIARNRRVLCASPAYLARFGTPGSWTNSRPTAASPSASATRISAAGSSPARRGIAIKVSGPLSANNGEIVRQWAIDGHGIILRSTWDVSTGDRFRLLVPVLPGYYQQADVWAVYPSRLSCRPRSRCAWSFSKTGSSRPA